MGYENREYFRDGSYTRGGSGGFLDDAPMCKKILIVTVVVFVAQMFFTRPANLADMQPAVDQIQQRMEEEEALYGGEVYFDADGAPIGNHRRDFDPEHLLASAQPVSIVQDWLKLDTDKVLKKGQIWRLITSAFCHDRFGILHIVFNMLFLYWFGRFVEATYGSKEFLCFYLVAALVASFAFIGLELFTGDRHGAIGASGAVMGVVCVFAMWNPHHTIRMYFMFPIQIRYLLLIYVIFDLHPVLLTLSGTVTHTGVAHAAHLGGLLFGYLYYKNDWRLLPYWNRASRLAGGAVGGASAKRRIRKSNLRVYNQESNYESESQNDRHEKTRADIRFDEQLDEVLKKITDSGQESLTDREKKILTLGSQRYRNR